MKLNRNVAGARQPLLIALLILAALTGLVSAQTKNLPPKPDTYFTDQANVVDALTGHQINEQLAQFERDTSNQILVAIYPELPPDADYSEYSIETAKAWGAGQKGKNNGAVLFVYVKDHRVFIATGRGLEGALPDAICGHIISNEIRPAFRAGNYAEGIQQGVNSMIAATKGEYTGTGQTLNEQQDQRDDSGGGLPGWVIAIIIIFFIISVLLRHSGFWGLPMMYSGGGWGGGSGFGGGGGGGGGGGFSGFSGGGGGFAGGGAGGSW